MPIRSLLLATLLLTFGAAFAQSPPGIDRAPDWATPAAVPDLRTDEPASNGLAYLLIDEQVRVDGPSHARYVHVAQGVVNGQGVADASQLSVSYDPSYQRLTLHQIAVRRGDEVIDQLRRDRIDMLRREPGLEAQLYDGNVTANVLLEDVRVGDVVEYAYTLDGANPILGGHYFGGFDLAWFTPARRVRHRLLWPSDRPLYIQPHHTDAEPAIAERGSVTEYRWTLDDVAALSFDDGLPRWYNPYPWVQLSEAASWGKVAAWGEPLFRRPAALPASLRPVVAAIADSTDDPAERTAAALRFAQEEIRYTGLEMGVGSHRPRPPADVLRTRFGDCKDKALLLATLLGALDIEADVALVSTRRGRGIDEWHPSPYAFDHAIVRAVVRDTPYWLDPTALNQRGRLDAITQSDHERALLLRPGTTALSVIDPPRPSAPDRRVTEILNLSAGVGQPGTYAVTTTYVGAAADEMRAHFASKPHDEIADDYLNYYSAAFPDIELAEPLAVDDDDDLNWFIVDERYTLANPWEEEEGSATVSLYARETSSLLEPPHTRRRTSPLGLGHPYHHQHSVEVLLPERWNVETIDETVEGDAFDFSVRAERNELLFTLNYEYRTTADHVPADAVTAHLDALDDARALVGYRLFQPIGAGGGPVNWPIFLLTLFLFGLALVVARRVYLWEPAEPPVDLAFTDQTLRGIRGWLLLVAFQLVVAPFVILARFNVIVSAFDPVAWDAVTQPGSPVYHALYAPLLLFELSANVFWVVFALLLPVLFFQRRRSFPRVYITYLIVTFAVVALDALGSALIPSVATTVASLKAVVQHGVGALVWSLYFSSSDRVEATFTEPRPMRRVSRRPRRPAPAVVTEPVPVDAP